jgi:ribosomal protein S1
MPAGDWKEVITMALSKVGQVTGGEITVINREKNFALLELDSAEPARLPLCKCKGDDRGARFDELKVGMEIRVLVIETNDGKFGKPFHTVSERLDEVIDVVADAPTARASNKPDPALAAKFPVGKRVKGPFAHMADNAVVIILDGVRALLPLSELGSMKVASLRKGMAVTASVLRVDGTGVVLSRKVMA